MSLTDDFNDFRKACDKIRANGGRYANAILADVSPVLAESIGMRGQTICEPYFTEGGSLQSLARNKATVVNGTKTWVRDESAGLELKIAADYKSMSVPVNGFDGQPVAVLSLRLTGITERKARVDGRVDLMQRAASLVAAAKERAAASRPTA